MGIVRHHPKTETLADFAAGRLDEARAVVIATHASLCADCARAIADFEAVGGALLDDIEPVAMSADGLEQVLARADAGANVHLRPNAPDHARPETNLPISAYIKGGLDAVKWRGVAPGLAQSVIEAQGYRPGVLRLLKIDPGTKMPRHTHNGSELTLILRGAYEDEVGEFRAGDLADLDEAHEHTPTAIGDEPCICLIATAAPLAFKTMAGRLAQPFIGL